MLAGFILTNWLKGYSISYWNKDGSQVDLSLGNRTLRFLAPQAVNKETAQSLEAYLDCDSVVTRLTGLCLPAMDTVYRVLQPYKIVPLTLEPSVKI